MIHLNAHVATALDHAVEAYNNAEGELQQLRDKLTKLKEEDKADGCISDLDNVAAAHARIGERDTKMRILERAIEQHLATDQEARLKRLMDDIASANESVLAAIRGQLDIEQRAVEAEARDAQNAMKKIAHLLPAEIRFSVGKLDLMDAIKARFDKDITDLRNSGKTPLEVAHNISQYLDRGGHQYFFVYKVG